MQHALSHGQGMEILSEMANKLIIPAEIKVCATCSFWDGERRVDEEMRLVVVDEDCHGECLVKASDRDGLHDVRGEHNCAWEDLGPDDTAGEEARPAP